MLYGYGLKPLYYLYDDEPVSSDLHQYNDEWTAEEFDDIYDNEMPFYTEAFQPKEGSLLDKIVCKIGERVIAKKADKDAKFIDFVNNAPYTATMLTTIQTELQNWPATYTFFGNMKIRLGIVNLCFYVFAATSLITREVMFRDKWGRFPGDFRSFLEHIFELPEDLSKEDVKKFKNELNKLRKDTKWLASGGGRTKITPKERELVTLLNKQVKDLLSFNMISKDFDKRTKHRVDERMMQLINTAKEFFELITTEINPEQLKKTIKDAMK